MKLKSRWIEEYSLETNGKHFMPDAISNTSEILKVYVKPKVLWFIRHMLFKNTWVHEMEEGEIISDDEYGDEVNLKNKETNKMVSEYEEVIIELNLYDLIDITPYLISMHLFCIR